MSCNSLATVRAERRLKIMAYIFNFRFCQRKWTDKCVRSQRICLTQDGFNLNNWQHRCISKGQVTDSSTWQQSRLAWLLGWHQFEAFSINQFIAQIKRASCCCCCCCWWSGLQEGTCAAWRCPDNQHPSLHPSWLPSWTCCANQANWKRGERRPKPKPNTN